MPELICPRLVDAVAAVTISHVEFLDIQLGRLDLDLVRRIMPLPNLAPGNPWI